MQLKHTRRGGRALRLGETWVIAQLGSCHLGKYPWKVAAWEKLLVNYLTFLKLPPPPPLYKILENIYHLSDKVLPSVETDTVLKEISVKSQAAEKKEEKEQEIHEKVKVKRKDSLIK